MINAVEKIGNYTLRSINSLRSTLLFVAHIIICLFDRRSYNSASRLVFFNQFYFTSVQILPLFLFVAVIFGSMVNGMAFQVVKNLGLTDYLGRLLMGFVVTEIAPFITVLLITLRSSSAINAEIAVMKVNRELDTLALYNIDMIYYLFVPRVLTGILSVVMLSSLFSMVVLSIGLFVSSAIFGMSVDDYIGVLMQSTSLQDVTITLIKCGTFGFFITLIPISLGLHTRHRELTTIPIAVRNGMVRVFEAIIFIEVLSLIIRFI
jgi:phospholipid/cholesterol/gamma-HCH transport system permease protein